MTRSLVSLSTRASGRRGGEINPRGKNSLQQKSFAPVVNTLAGTMFTIFALFLTLSSSSLAAAQPRKGAGNLKYPQKQQQERHDNDYRFVRDSIHYMELTNRASTKWRNRYLLTINEIFGGTSASASTDSTPLSDDLYQKCLSDLQLADADFDSRLSNSEFVDFINLNSYFFYNADTMNELPLNFPLLFHSTACLCTLKEDISAEEAEDCCAGSNGHIEIYGGGNSTNATNATSPATMNEEEDAYMRAFCTEAWYSYGATMHPTRSPVVSTDSPTASPTDGGTTVAPTVLPTTLPPAMPSTSTPTTTSPNAPPVDSTSAPTAMEPETPTKTPSTISTASPVAVPTAAPDTSLPTKAPSSTTTLSPTAAPPASQSPIAIATSSPTPSPSSIAPPTGGGGGGAVLPIGIQYGISSNCGVTAQDVLNETNNTVKYGLESATTTVLIGILNETYPRTEERASVRSGNYNSDDGDEEEGDGNTSSSSSNGSDFKVVASGVRVQVPNGHYKLFQEAVRNENEKGRRRSRLLKDSVRHARKLVYYTDEHPVIITDVEDVVDQACPPGQNCMRVMSTILVVLEEGDDPEEITQVVRLRIEQSFNDGSFFESIPPDTIFCPGDTVPPSPAATGSPTLPPVPSTSNTPTLSPSMDATSSPTLPPVPLSTGTPTQAPSVPTTSSPTMPPIPASTGTPTASPSVRITSTPTLPPVTMAPTVSPTAKVTTAPTTSPVSVGTGPPTQSPVGSSVSETPTPAPTPGSTGSPPTNMDPLRIQITYDIANDCGLDAEAVFNEDGTTLKTGLEAATATTTIGILNATFPRTDAAGKRKKRTRTMRQLSEQSLSNLIQPHDNMLTSRRQRHLVYYTDEYPVTIDRIIDITTDCAPGNNCLLIISTITVLPEAGDDLDAISSAIENGMKESFDDGTFFGNIPEDTVVCPTRRNMQKVMNDGDEVVMSRSSRGNEPMGLLYGRARLLKFVALR